MSRRDGDQPSLRDERAFPGKPWIEIHGYFRLSLRDMNAAVAALGGLNVSINREVADKAFSQKGPFSSVPSVFSVVVKGFLHSFLAA